MSYDFDQLIDRRQNNSYKWGIKENELPMWVADMDFATAPAITEALKSRLEENAFGYNTVPEEFFASFINWWQDYHQVSMQKSGLMFCTGVVPAISSIVRKVTKVHDNVVILTPVYNIFFNSILNNQRQVLASPMTYHEGNYQIDFEDLEEKLALKETTLFIFCNPHNPIGKVWSQADLEKIGALCVKHQVLLLSDEIHCDLTHEGYQYRSFIDISPAISQQLIVCLAPTKAFNLAGLQTSAIYVENPALFEKVNRGINTDEVAEPNTFAIQAAIAAFTDGRPWLEALNSYLSQNRKILTAFFKKRFPEIRLIESQATYLAWLDCSALTKDTADFCQFLRRTTGLILSEGDIFGGNGQQFVRWNYACPVSRLQDGLERFEKGTREFLLVNKK
ncbi:MalY/PatB family protein [Enterococcus sp. LJL120]